MDGAAVCYRHQLQNDITTWLISQHRINRTVVLWPRRSIQCKRSTTHEMANVTLCDCNRRTNGGDGGGAVTINRRTRSDNTSPSSAPNQKKREHFKCKHANAICIEEKVVASLPPLRHFLTIRVIFRPDNTQHDQCSAFRILSPPPPTE